MEKSGGIATNIGVHFRYASFVYGALQDNIVHLNTPIKAAGFLEYEHARVRWFLSLDENDIPDEERARGKRTYRSVVADDVHLEFSDGFTDLHTEIYKHALAGKGFGLEENRVAIETVTAIRNAVISPNSGLMHPFASFSV